MATPEIAYQELREQLRHYVAKRLNRPDEVDDVLQDVFLRVIRNDKSFQSAASPIAWLYTVTRSVLIDHYRRRSSNPVHNSIELETDKTPDLSVRPEADFGACVVPLVKKLPEKYREAVEFVDLQDGRQTVLARQTGVSVSAAKSRVQRGRRMLKELILGCCRVELDSFNQVVSMDRIDKSQKECC